MHAFKLLYFISRFTVVVLQYNVTFPYILLVDVSPFISFYLFKNNITAPFCQIRQINANSHIFQYIKYEIVLFQSKQAKNNIILKYWHEVMIVWSYEKCVVIYKSVQQE